MFPESEPAVALRLRWSTPPAWAAAQCAHAAELLVDQAHLERKAAAAALQFLFRLPVVGPSQRVLSALAREELTHFERTLRLLRQRKIAFTTLVPSPYAERLKAGVARDLPGRLADELVVAALIEARSQERMALLATAFAPIDGELAAFYGELAVAEARHAPAYLDLARRLLGAAELGARCAVLAEHEAAVVRALPCGPRLHSGWPESG
ncbi:MAG: tRNA isopentenyl-2-thiomethyl-A-37 hydroxylase MiaE [Planctomycetota bacterium]